MKLNDILAKYHATREDLVNYIYENRNDLKSVFNGAKALGFSNDNIAEAFGVTIDVVKQVFKNYGDLDAVSNPSKVLTDDQASSFAAKTITNTSSAFMHLLVDKLKTGGADLDLQNGAQYQNETSIYPGQNGDIETMLNFLVNMVGRITPTSLSQLTQNVSSITGLLRSADALDVLANIYSTPEVHNYYNTVNAIALANTWSSTATTDAIEQNLLVGINNAYNIYNSTGSVFML